MSLRRFLPNASLATVSAVANTAVRDHQIMNFLKAVHLEYVPISCTLRTLNLLAMWPEGFHYYEDNKKIKKGLNPLLKKTKKNNMIKKAAFAGAVVTTAGHIAIYYESFTETFAPASQHDEHPHPSRGQVIGFLFLASSGALQELLSGGLHLAHAAFEGKSLLYSEDTFAKNVGINILISLAASGDGMLFFKEINELYPNVRAWGVQHLVVVSPAMTLTHDGHLFSEVLKDPKRLIPKISDTLSGVRFSLQLLHSIFHGLSRGYAVYHAFSDDLAKPLSISLGSVVGLTIAAERYATFIPELSTHKPNQIHGYHYTAQQLGEDLLFQAIWVALFNIAHALDVDNKRPLIETFVCMNMLSGLINQVLWVPDKIGKAFSWNMTHKEVLTLATEVAFAPIITMLLQLAYMSMAPDWSKGAMLTLVVLTTLVNKHLIKKFLYGCDPELVELDHGVHEDSNDLNVDPTASEPLISSQANTPTEEEHLQVELSEVKTDAQGKHIMPGNMSAPNEVMNNFEFSLDECSNELSGDKEESDDSDEEEHSSTKVSKNESVNFSQGFFSHVTKTDTSLKAVYVPPQIKNSS